MDMEEKAMRPGRQSDEAPLAEVSGVDLEKFAALTKLIRTDLNRFAYRPFTFGHYTKKDIQRFLSNPARFERQLRRAIIYIYGASPHFRRLMQYFTSLSDLAYVVEPYRIDPKRASKAAVNRNYRQVLNTLSIMNIPTQFKKIISICLREDVFYGTMLIANDDIMIQRLPSDYCRITTVEGGVCNVTFDFSYFDYYPLQLEYYPEEFKEKYKLYKSRNKTDVTGRWIELDSPNSFAVKCCNDILDYALPPFAGILREIYDLEERKKFALTKELIENYALLVMRLPLNDDGTWHIDYDKAVEFWRNLDAVMPEEVGSVLSPMQIDKISFERTRVGDSDTITNAEENLFTAAGVQSLLFNNSKASANALALSIKVDQELTYGIVKSLEDVVNRFLHEQKYGKNWVVRFLDVSPFNRKEAGDAYLKACQYGIPMISYYCASQGLGQAELDSMNFLETDVLELYKIFKPLQSSAQMSGSTVTEGNGATEEGGRPALDPTELTDSGEQTSEQRDDWG